MAGVEQDFPITLKLKVVKAESDLRNHTRVLRLYDCHDLIGPRSASTGQLVTTDSAPDRRRAWPAAKADSVPAARGVQRATFGRRPVRGLALVPETPQGAGIFDPWASSKDKRTQQLIELIYATARIQEEWEIFGDNVGSIHSYDEMLLVKHTPIGHQQVQELLTMLREALAKRQTEQAEASE